MARKGTTNLNLGTWTDKENPGAGSQDIDNTALNGNWVKIDNALGGGHNTDGTHKNGIIDGANLKSTVADGVTLVQDADSKKLKVNPAGIGTAHIADSAITGAKLNVGAVTTAKLAASAVTSNELAANAVSTAKIQDGAVTGVKIADGAITSAKLAAGATSGSGYIVFGDTRVAAAASGSSASAITEWEESGSALLAKISTLVRPRPGDKYIKLIANAKTLNSKGWKVELNYGGTAVTATGTNTGYDPTTHEVVLQIDVTPISANDIPVEVQVKLCTISTPNTASMTNVVLMMTPN
jgi:hypothetical protein